MFSDHKASYWASFLTLDLADRDPVYNNMHIADKMAVAAPK